MLRPRWKLRIGQPLLQPREPVHALCCEVVTQSGKPWCPTTVPSVQDRFWCSDRMPARASSWSAVDGHCKFSFCSAMFPVFLCLLQHCQFSFALAFTLSQWYRPSAGNAIFFHGKFQAFSAYVRLPSRFLSLAVAFAGAFHPRCYFRSVQKGGVGSGYFAVSWQWIFHRLGFFPSFWFTGNLVFFLGMLDSRGGMSASCSRKAALDGRNLASWTQCGSSCKGLSRPSLKLEFAKFITVWWGNLWNICWTSAPQLGDNFFQPVFLAFLTTQDCLDVAWHEGRVYVAGSGNRRLCVWRLLALFHPRQWAAVKVKFRNRCDPRIRFKEAFDTDARPVLWISSFGPLNFVWAFWTFSGLPSKQSQCYRSGLQWGCCGGTQGPFCRKELGAIWHRPRSYLAGSLGLAQALSPEQTSKKMMVAHWGRWETLLVCCLQMIYARNTEVLGFVIQYCLSSAMIGPALAVVKRWLFWHSGAKGVRVHHHGQTTVLKLDADEGNGAVKTCPRARSVEESSMQAQNQPDATSAAAKYLRRIQSSRLWSFISPKRLLCGCTGT